MKNHRSLSVFPALSVRETISISGGTTDFAYDIGALLRIGFQVNATNYKGAFCTLANWLVQS